MFRTSLTPETIEVGRMPMPAFGTIACLSDVLGLPIEDLAAEWRADLRPTPLFAR